MIMMRRRDSARGALQAGKGGFTAPSPQAGYGGPRRQKDRAVRWFMILIIAAGLLAGAWPAAKVLWDMETGASPVAVGLADGTVQAAEIGPKSYWPAWAPPPAGTKFAVRAYFGPGNGTPETGYAELGGFSDAARVQADYASLLSASGWEVTPMNLTVALPEGPPRNARLCVVQARKDGNSLMLSVTTDTQGLSRLHWFKGPQPPISGAVEGFCR
jgi:hypothetical protein